MHYTGSKAVKKILIVDDQSEIRKLIRLTLMRRYELLEAENAADALEIIGAERPDAVVLDVMMPGEMDGYQLCNKIKQDPALCSIHVALVTARGQSVDQEQGTAVGADGYFVKPFSPMALVHHLDESLG
jgi:two-component system phosphate regulon response regulator PhoB